MTSSISFLRLAAASRWRLASCAASLSMLAARARILAHVHLVALEEKHLDFFLKRSGALDGKLKLDGLAHRTALEAAGLGLLDNLDGV